MGGSTSKLTPSIDLSQASIPVAELQRQVREQANLAAQTASSSTWGTAKIIFWILSLLLVVGLIGTGIWYYFFERPNEQVLLKFDSVKLLDPSYGISGLDITNDVQSHVVTDSISLPKGISQIPNITCFDKNGSPITPCQSIIGNVAITYHFEGNKPGLDTSVKSPAPFPVTQSIDISIANETENFTNKKPTKSSSSTQNKTGSSILGKIKNVFNYSGSSADLLPYPKDATALATIPSSSAPLSGGQEGAYGMQFWMYIKDWNHNFGKDKFIISRNDSTNSNIGNPEVSLHPTDNTMKISISIFPDNHENSSKSEPAPAGHSSSTDDVFVCEIPDIPLQAWTSVSITTFSRNLDVYLNGKLVKSCLLSGVPKPASGDIILNKDGGFSGYLCSFFHYPRMLVPSDAQTFYGQGTSCTSVTDPSTSTKVTGYGFKFGVYDAAGKEINQYVL